MAKQYLDANGVNQLWTKCKDTFALKNGGGGSDFPTIPMFKADINNWNPDKISFSKDASFYYCKCENGFLIISLHLTFKVNETASFSLLGVDYGFYDKSKLSSIAPYLVDAQGVQLSKPSAQDGSLIGVVRTTATELNVTGYASRNNPINFCLCRGAKGFANIAQLYLALSPAQTLDAGFERSINASLTIPLFKI